MLCGALKTRNPSCKWFDGVGMIARVLVSDTPARQLERPAAGEEEAEAGDADPALQSLAPRGLGQATQRPPGSGRSRASQEGFYFHSIINL